MGMEKVYDEFISRFNKNNIEDILYELPQIVIHYQKILFTAKGKLIELEHQSSNIYIDKFLHYKHDFDISLKNNEVSTFIEKDKDVLKYSYNISKVKTLIENTENILKELNNLQWTIKNIIDLKKLENAFI